MTTGLYRCEGHNPVEYHSIETYLNAEPAPEEQNDNLLLTTLQGTSMYAQTYNL